MQLHLQAIARAGREGQLDDGELQALFNLRAEREQEKQWVRAEAQHGLVQMGSSTIVADLAAAGQISRAADALTEAEFTRIGKEAENTLQLIELQKQLRERTTQVKGYNKREADLDAMDRGLEQGKHSKKGTGTKALEGSHPYKKGRQVRRTEVYGEAGPRLHIGGRRPLKQTK